MNTPPPKLDVRVVDSVTAIGPEAWNALSAGRPFQSYRWYRFGETVLSGCTPAYILVSHRGEPVARAAFWLKRQEWLTFSSALVRSGVEKFIKRWPFLTCEAPLVSAPGLVLADPSLRKAALDAITDAALEQCRKNPVSFVVFGYTPEEEVRRGDWPGSFSAFSLSGADTFLEIAWPDFDSYLKSLGRSARRNYRPHGRQAAEMGIEIEIHPTIDDPEAALALIRNVEGHHRVSHRPWARRMIEHAGLLDATWITARSGNRLLGCGLLLGEEDYQFAALLGLDYAIPNTIYVYYQILFAAIRNAIEGGKRILYGGGGAYELKQRLGFRMLPDDYLVVAGANRLFRWIVRGLAPWVGVKPVDSVPADDLDIDHEDVEA